MIRFDDSPAAAGFYLPQEWAPHEKCFIGWPVPGDSFVEVIDFARVAAAALARHIAEFEPVCVVVRPEDLPEAQLACGGAVSFVEVDYDSCWIRDIGPSLLTNEAGKIVGTTWRFNGWGNRLPHLRDEFLGSHFVREIDVPAYECPLVLEGGSVEIDGRGSVLANRACLQSKDRNPTLSEQQIEERLAFYIGARNVIWVNDGFDGDPSYGRVGLNARFAGEDRVLINMPKEKDDPNCAVAQAYRAVLSSKSQTHGRSYELIDIPQPQARFSMDGHRLPLSYLDFLFVEKGVILPAFDDPLDDEVAQLFTSLFPGIEICQINMLPLSLGGGGIHRLTLQMPKVG